MTQLGDQRQATDDRTGNYPCQIAAPSDHAGVARALKASFARLPLPEEWRRLLGRIR